ncbi:MAG: ribonuclease III [Acidobacteria bacterium]|nr:ribonuclease III [Acidobacteriota bacterium]MBI3662916.1 ribonuclease III [Acidobacteriota bacterium]
MDTTLAAREELEAALGHRFREAAWLERALTHSSRRQDVREKAAEDNEKLELLGDTILGLAITEQLLAAFPDWTVGRLTQARAQLVNARSLQAAANRLQLGRFLLVGSAGEKEGIREQRDPLADAYEALIGAIYCDAGLAAAADFVRRTLLDEALREQADSLGDPDHKSALMLWLQSRGQRLPEYSVVNETGPDHRKRFVVEVRIDGRPFAEGDGSSKKEAEQVAARLALARLRDSSDARERA